MGDGGSALSYLSTYYGRYNNELSLRFVFGLDKGFYMLLIIFDTIVHPHNFIGVIISLGPWAFGILTYMCIV